MVKAKEDMVKAIVINYKGNPTCKPQRKPITKVVVVAWPLHNINLLNWKN
jgi:hypothetical protein